MLDLQELINVIKKAMKEHPKGSLLPDSFVNQYYEILIRLGFEEPTFEDLLRKFTTEKERQIVFNHLYVRTMNFITDMLEEDMEG